MIRKAVRNLLIIFMVMSVMLIGTNSSKKVYASSIHRKRFI